MSDDFLTILRNANAARQKEWDPNKTISLFYRGCELAGEAGEACNIIKKLERETNGLRGTRTSPRDLADELADVAICTDLLVMDAGVAPRPLSRFRAAKTYPSLSEAGCHLSASVGMLNQRIIEFTSDQDYNFLLKHRVEKIFCIVEDILKMIDHDFESSIVRKFNATSEKYNLETRIQCS
jgi:NTP pyrophosphatase (non-canonical NTP hydrolase)